MSLQPVRLTLGDITNALRRGQAMTRAMPAVSIAYAAVFTLLGLVLLTAIGLFGLSPLALPFAGGFMLVGPVLLTGYFALARTYENNRRARFADAVGAFRDAPVALWLVALLCAFLFLIWITDAGVLYSFTIGGIHLGYDPEWLPEQGHEVLMFTLWGSLMGSALAFMIFTISAFSVPLIHEHRTGLIEAVNASVRTVFGNFPVMMAWGILLGGVIVLSILLLPLLLFTLPVMSYASFSLYRAAFPLTVDPATADGENSP